MPKKDIMEEHTYLYARVSDALGWLDDIPAGDPEVERIVLKAQAHLRDALVELQQLYEPIIEVTRVTALEGYL